MKTIIPAALLAVATVGCATHRSLTDAQLSSMGVINGVSHWDATGPLVRQGYNCSVSGRVRENFDCTKNVGFFPTCVLRIKFSVDEENKVVGLRSSEPACIGTP